MIIHTWQLVVAAVAGWVSKEQRDMIAYIMEENEVLKEQLDKHRGRRRILLTNGQRRRLADCTWHTAERKGSGAGG